nr:hypothetical protein BdHM001_36170 [Bdellovibrio sp. HM001]
MANSKIQADVDHVQYALENCTTEGIYDAISRNDIAGIDLNPEEIEEDEE